MKNLGWMHRRTCSSISSTGSSVNLFSGGNTTTSNRSIGISYNNSNNVYCNHLIRRSYVNYYRPWWNYNRSNNRTNRQLQQIALFCKKTKKMKETVSTIVTNTNATNDGTVATTSNSSASSIVNANTSSSSSKNTVRRKKKDPRTNTSTTTNHSDTMIQLIPLSDHHSHSNIRSASTVNNSKNRTTIPASAGIATKHTVRMKSVYVHPLSQMVLQCLQTHCHDWVQSKKLHHLKMHVDGTFVTESIMTPPPPPPPTVQPLPASKVIVNDGSIIIPNVQKNESIGLISKTITDGSRKYIKIWTEYDNEERKHWLCVTVAVNDVDVVHKKNIEDDSSNTIHPAFKKVFLLQNRYMLQDNTLTPWQSYSKVRGSIPERIQTYVYELIHAVDSVCLYNK